MPNVLFLRAPQSPDRYESIFSTAGYKSSSVPVLETVFVNLEALTDTVRSGPQHGAVIITSSRACEAWGRSHFSWSSIPFYVVGKSTATSLKAIREARPDSRFTPTDIRGESSGTSEQLANFILTDLESLPPPSRNKPFLCLTGDKNRDTLPNILRGGGVALSALQNLPRTDFSSTDSDIWWIVFFAPSAAEFVTPFLRLHFDLGSVDATTHSTRRAARVASIGPTTSTFLQDKLDIAVDAVASKPTQDDLLQVIRAYDRDRDG
ncbi:tetrapyrrole biosynthesis, uroporphyrinogen III synthase [Mycena olivaceomarginata]|nr:tetrapyrrole biosynthesis, uroporphyrinogen III synthase [Mycena olivaceomarginata]